MRAWMFSSASPGSVPANGSASSLVVGAHHGLERQLEALDAQVGRYLARVSLRFLGGVR